jgi:hypothetical protein
LIQGLKARATSQAAPSSEEAPGGPYGPGIGESIAEAERLSRELRNLASAAQVLAARLQVQGRG